MIDWLSFIVNSLIIKQGGSNQFQHLKETFVLEGLTLHHFITYCNSNVMVPYQTTIIAETIQSFLWRKKVSMATVNAYVLFLVFILDVKVVLRRL